jgi:hypothetical protein
MDNDSEYDPESPVHLEDRLDINVEDMDRTDILPVEHDDPAASGEVDELTSPQAVRALSAPSFGISQLIHS